MTKANSKPLKQIVAEENEQSTKRLENLHRNIRTKNVEKTN